MRDRRDRSRAIRKRWETVGSKLDERGGRVFAAGEVRAAGWGGLEAVSEITGLARSTIGRGRVGSRRPLRPCRKARFAARVAAD